MTDEVERYKETGYVRSLWLGLLAGPLVWIIYFLVGYLMVEVACEAGLGRAGIFGLALIPVLTVGLTVVALGLVVYAGIWDYRHWQRIDRQREQVDPGMKGTDVERAAEEEQVERWQRSRFMAYTGLLLSLLFALTILLTGVPALVLRPCG